MMNYSRIHLMDIRFLLDQNKGYMYYMEEYIDKSIAKFTARYEAEDFEALKLSDERGYDSRMDMLSETWQEINRDYPSHFRLSFLTQAYSAFESGLTKICNHYHQVKKTPLSPQETKGKNDMATLRKFLTTQAGVSFVNFENDWKYIDLIRRVRNRIIHHQNKINPAHGDWTAIRTLIKDNPDKMSFREDPDETDDDGSPYSTLRPKLGFSFTIDNSQLNEQFLDVMESFFKQLLNHELDYAV